MRYDHACKNLDRHPNNILAAYMARPAPKPSPEDTSMGAVPV